MHGCCRARLRLNGRKISNDNKRLWCLKQYQLSEKHPVKVEVLTFQLGQDGVQSWGIFFVRQRQVADKYCNKTKLDEIDVIDVISLTRRKST